MYWFSHCRRNSHNFQTLGIRQAICSLPRSSVVLEMLTFSNTYYICSIYMNQMKWIYESKILYHNMISFDFLWTGVEWCRAEAVIPLIFGATIHERPDTNPPIVQNQSWDHSIWAISCVLQITFCTNSLRAWSFWWEQHTLLQEVLYVTVCESCFHHAAPSGHQAAAVSAFRVSASVLVYLVALICVCSDVNNCGSEVCGLCSVWCCVCSRVKCVDMHPVEPWMMAALYNGTVQVFISILCAKLNLSHILDMRWYSFL